MRLACAWLAEVKVQTGLRWRERKCASTCTCLAKLSKTPVMSAMTWCMGNYGHTLPWSRVPERLTPFLQHLQRVVGTSERFAAEPHQPFLLWQLFGLCCYCLPHTQQECAQVAVIHQYGWIHPYFHVFSTFNLSPVPWFSSVHSPFGCHFT